MSGFKKIIFSFFLAFASFAFAKEPIAVYLTWMKNPESTMVVHWLTPSTDHLNEVIYYAEGECDKLVKKGSTHSLPEGQDDTVQHTVELTNLEPGTTYFFHVGGGDKTYKFRTPPATLTKPFKFVVGGDLYHDFIETLDETNAIAGQYAPYFFVAGGDLAYSNTRDGKTPDKFERWVKLLRSWQKYLVTPEGHLIPILPVIGNEDTKGRYDQPSSSAPFFYALFAKGNGEGYTLLDFGNYLTFFLLDSQHTHNVYGDQQYWLQKSLEWRAHIPFKFAAYHFPAFPSVRPASKHVSQLIRRYWVPSFEEHGIIAAFEHHDHAYKRTHPIKNFKIDPSGVLYLGDGGMGVLKPRKPVKASDRWYLAHTAPKRHFFLVTIYPDGTSHFQAIDHKNEVFDETTLPLPSLPQQKGLRPVLHQK